MWVYFWPPYDDYSAMRWPCLEGYHVPIDSERQSLIDILTTTFWLAQNGTTVKTYLKMPYAWYLAPKTWGKSSQGTVWYYWTCIWLSYDAYFITFNDSTLNVTSNPNTPWYNVRPFKDVPIKPDNNWAVLYDWSSVAIWAWIYHNSTLWLISISWDWKSWATIADKNLWATIVYDSGDTLSESNCGWYFQWGNNYTFPFTWAVTTSSTKVDASAYWPWNYYSSSTFIKVSTKASRNSTNNINLRWWETWVVLKRELKNAYIGEVHTYTFDFQNDWALWWTITARSEASKWYTAGQWFYLTSNWYNTEFRMIPPASFFNLWIPSRIRLRWTKPTATNYGLWIGGISWDYNFLLHCSSQNNSTAIWCQWDTWNLASSITWEVLFDMNINGNNVYGTVNSQDYSLNSSMAFSPLWTDNQFCIFVVSWKQPTWYIRKMEITVNG